MNRIFRTFHISHRYACVYMLDDLEGGVDPGGFGEGFYKGIGPFNPRAWLAQPAFHAI
jgi:hypothetical protein